MDLGALVQQTVEINNSVTFFELNNGFAIGCEVDDSGETKYCILNNLGGHTEMPFGHNAKSLPNGGPSSLSNKAKKLLESYATGLEDPLKQINGQVRDIYDQILEPIEIRSVRRPNFSLISQVIGITAVYPLALAGTVGYLGMKSFLGKNQHGDDYLMMGTLTAPFLLPGAIKELVCPSVSGVKIKNREILESELNGEDYVGIDNYGRFNPRFFGDSSSVKGRKAFLNVIFSDGLILSESTAYYPANGNPYSSAQFFFPFDVELKEQLDGLLEQKDRVYQNWRNFEKNVQPEDVAKLVI